MSPPRRRQRYYALFFRNARCFVVAGNIMTISYIAGTTAGSVFAYVLDKIIHYDMGFPVGGWAGGEYHRTPNAIMRGGFEIINKTVLQVVVDAANRTVATATASPALFQTSAASHLGALLLQTSSSSSLSSHVNSTATTAFPG